MIQRLPCSKGLAKSLSRVSGGDSERRVSEEGRRSGTKSYRDVSAEKGQAIEGSATAWADVLQNGIKPSKQNKSVDKSRRLNPPSGVVEDNSRVYGNEPIQQEENSAGYDTQKSVVSEDDNISNGKKAMQRVIENHEDVNNAMYRDDVGSIDFVWGSTGKGKKFKGGYGVAHIIAKRNADFENGRSTVDGETTVKKLVEVIAKGKDVTMQNTSNNDTTNARMKIHYDGYTAVLSMSDKNKNTWLLTGWEDEKTAQKNEVPVNANGKGNGSTAATPDMPMRTRHAEETDTSSTSTVSQNQQNVKENLKSIIIGGEKYYIADTPSEPNSKSGKKKKAAAQAKKETESHTADEKPANAKENPKTIAVNGETFYFEKPSGVGLPLAMYGNKKSLFGKGAEKKKTIYRTNRQQYGNEVEVRTDDGKAIKVHYALIPADKLIASNKADDTLSKNEAYPQDLQPRDRQRTAMRLQVDSMANSLRPEDLADSRNLNQGAPIVRSDLTVLNGNGRTLAIQKAYQTGKAEEYKQYLLDNAEKLGLDKGNVAAMVNGRSFLNTKTGKHEKRKE